AVENEVDDFLERYDATAAARAIMTFVDDDVANWYVRRSRDRFYDVESADNRAAFATLHEVLVVTCRLLAPIAPFLSDWVHRELRERARHPARKAQLPVAGQALREEHPARRRCDRGLHTGRTARVRSGERARRHGGWRDAHVDARRSRRAQERVGRLARAGS